MNHIAPPIFIIGIMERSGTNFLADIIQMLDPKFQLPRVLGEDFLLEHCHLLEQYAELTYKRWKRLPWLENPEKCKQLLVRNLGKALLALLSDQIGPDKRLLAKTPRAFNIDQFFLLFPEVKLLLLVRDGRDVVESAATTWPYESYEHWIRQWAQGARLILDFMRGLGRHSRGQLWELVKYEDLVKQPKEIARSLSAFLGSENESLDWREIERLPVRASSQYHDAKGEVKWEATPKTQDFVPIGRWLEWSRHRKWKFKRIAGRELLELGYVSDNHW